MEKGWRVSPHHNHMEKGWRVSPHHNHMEKGWRVSSHHDDLEKGRRVSPHHNDVVDAWSCDAACDGDVESADPHRDVGLYHTNMDTHVDMDMDLYVDLVATHVEATATKGCH